jgi:acetyl-CoA acetyltransferase
MADKAEHSAVISGIGASRIGRRLSTDGLALTVEAVLAAVADAGLELADIDGISTYPGHLTATPGYSPVGVTELKEALRLELNWYTGSNEVAGQLGAVVNAVAAVHAGFAKHVLCFRSLTESSAQTGTRRASLVGAGRDRIDDSFQWRVPFLAGSAATWVAMSATRYFHEFGATREQLGEIPLACRRHAALNDNAVYRTPLTMQDYLDARMIATPLGLYDCDVPVDGSVVVVVSHRETVPGLRRPPVLIEAVGSALHGRDSWDQRDDVTTMGATDAAEMMWNRTDLKPNDVDTAQVYDGFSYLALAWLEALGFCEHGDGARFVEGGTRISLGGELPINTAGGQLSAGRMHGFGLLHEACVQLRGDGGARQVTDAQVAAVGVGGGPLGASLLLTRG